MTRLPFSAIWPPSPPRGKFFFGGGRVVRAPGAGQKNNPPMFGTFRGINGGRHVGPTNTEETAWQQKWVRTRILRRIFCKNQSGSVGQGKQPTMRVHKGFIMTSVGIFVQVYAPTSGYRTCPRLRLRLGARNDPPLLPGCPVAGFRVGFVGVAC